jgi:hypothetical protein
MYCGLRHMAIYNITYALYTVYTNTKWTAPYIERTVVYVSTAGVYCMVT